MQQSNSPASRWVDSKRYWWLLSPAVIFVAGMGLIGFWKFEQAWMLWLAFGILYGVMPLMDWIVGEDRTNPPESAIADLEADPYYSWISYAFLPLQMGILAFGGWLAVTHDLPWYHLMGLAMSVGIINGFGINTAHELGHKKSKFDRWMARLALAPTLYGHFFVEHNRGHHKNVATPHDPASSRFGESFYAFLPRTVIGSFKSAWQLEAERLARSGHGVWSVKNENLQSWSMSVVLFGVLIAALGWAVVPYLIIQAVYGFSLLEVVNYLEHYGLLRQRTKDGRFERCEPEHSWNSNHVVTNLFLYQLQRHSDHHANPTRHYQSLRHFDNSPQLPSGYAGMVLLAYIPPLWFAVMNKRVIAHYKGDLSRINMHPPKRAALLEQYGRVSGARAART